jgi:hypothetical protein
LNSATFKDPDDHSEEHVRRKCCRCSCLVRYRWRPGNEEHPERNARIPFLGGETDAAVPTNIRRILLAGAADAKLPDAEDPDHERRVNNHVRRDGVVAERVNPGIARAQCQYTLNHPGSKVAEQDEQQRECSVTR